MGSESKQREVWLRWRYNGFLLPIPTALHWKGFVLLVAPFAALATLRFTAGRSPSFLALYWLGAFIFVILYGMALAGHSDWE